MDNADEGPRPVVHYAMLLQRVSLVRLGALRALYSGGGQWISLPQVAASSSDASGQRGRGLETRGTQVWRRHELKLRYDH